MAELLEALSKTPVPIILILAGLIFLAFAILEISVDLDKVKITKPASPRRITSGIVGAILLVAGVALSPRPDQGGLIAATSGASTAASMESSPASTTAETSAPVPAEESTTEAPSATPATTVAPTMADTAAPPEQAETVAISEVVAAPCTAKGKTDGPPSNNEYIELYNYGSQPVDVGGWWIATNGGARPQEIVSWDSRNPGAIPEHYQVLTKTTAIPPHRFAVILAPLYQMGDPGIHEPYALPEGAIILTVSNGNHLGNDRTGLLGNQEPRTVILLYVGTESSIQNPVSTYGTPAPADSPMSIHDDGSDLLPLFVQDCHSVVRRELSGPDAYNNWHVIKPATPGTE